MSGIKLGTIVGSELIFGLWPHWLELSGDQLRTHVHLLGTTGSGKTMLLNSMFLESLKVGRATTLIDPTGGSVEYILSYLCDRGFFNDPTSYERLIYLEFSDGDYFFPINILKLPWATTYETASIVIEAFMRAYPEIAEGAANFYKMMDAGIKVLIANDLPLVCMEELLTIKGYRDRLLARVQDTHVLSFFRSNFDDLIAYHRQSQTASTLNRAYDIVASNVLRNCLGQSENKLDLRQLMDSGNFLLVNLGRVKDPKTQRLLGAFITHAFEMAAMSRVPNAPLPPHFLMLDEFAAFAAQSGETLAAILTRTRQYGLFLTLSHQDLSQTSSELAGALGGCGVKISFRSNPGDAERQAKTFADFDLTAIKGVTPQGGPILASVQDQYEAWATAIKNLQNRQALVRASTSKTRLIRTPTLPTPSFDSVAMDAVRAEYFRRYYTHKDNLNIPIGMAAASGAAYFASRQRMRP